MTDDQQVWCHKERLHDLHAWHLKCTLIVTSNWTWPNIYSQSVIKWFCSNHQNCTTMKLKYNFHFNSLSLKRAISFYKEYKSWYALNDFFYSWIFPLYCFLHRIGSLGGTNITTFPNRPNFSCGYIGGFKIHRGPRFRVVLNAGRPDFLMLTADIEMCLQGPILRS